MYGYFKMENMKQPFIRFNYRDSRHENKRFISWLDRTTSGINPIAASSLPNPLELFSKITKQPCISGNLHIFKDCTGRMFIKFEDECLNDDAFSWIEPNDSRLCYFCWRILSRIRDCHSQSIGELISVLNSSLISPSTLIKPRQIIPQISLAQIAYYETNQPTKPINAKEIVTYYIDALNIKREHKDKLLGYMHHLYLDVMKNKSLEEDWLIKSNPEQIKWTEQYLKNKTGFVNRLVGKKLLLIDMQSHLDVLFLTDEPVWRLTMAQMKKAWGQKNYRNNREDKKQFSFDMSIDVAEWLDFISKHEKTTKSELVEALIREKFNIISSIEKASQ